MASNFPTSIDNYPDPSAAAGHFLDTATPDVRHAVLHSNVNRALFNTQTKVGTNLDVNTASVDWQMRNHVHSGGALTGDLSRLMSTAGAYGVISRLGGTTTGRRWDGLQITSGGNNTTQYQAVLDDAGNKGGAPVLVIPAIDTGGLVTPYLFTGPITLKQRTTLTSGTPAVRGGEVGMGGVIMKPAGGWSGTKFIDAKGDGTAAGSGIFGLCIDFSSVSLSKACVHMDAHGVMCEMNWIKGGAHAIFVGDASGQGPTGVTNGFVFGNRMEAWQSGGSGVMIDGASDCMILMNFIEGMPGSGIGITLSGGGHLIENNHLTGHSTAGYGIDIQSQGNTIIGNYLDSHGEHNISIGGGGDMNSIIGNRIYRNGADAETVHIDGIEFRDVASSGHHTIVGNYFERNREAPNQRFTHCVHFNAAAPARMVVVGNSGDPTVSGPFFANVGSATETANYAGA